MSVQRNRGKKGRKPQNDPTHVSSDLIIYRGPVSSRKTQEGLDTLEVSLKSTANMITASGVIADVFSNDPSGASDWSSYGASYTEFRVLAMMLEYEPNNLMYQNVSGASNYGYGPIVVTKEHTSNVTALSSLAAAIAISGAKFRSAIKGWKETWRMSGTEEAQFQSVGSPAVTGSIKVYGGSVVSNSTTIGSYVTTYLVQFRARK